MEKDNLQKLFKNLNRPKPNKENILRSHTIFPYKTQIKKELNTYIHTLKYSDCLIQFDGKPLNFLNTIHELLNNLVGKK